MRTWMQSWPHGQSSPGTLHYVTLRRITWHYAHLDAVVAPRAELAERLVVGDVGREAAQVVLHAQVGHEAHEALEESMALECNGVM